VGQRKSLDFEPEARDSAKLVAITSPPKHDVTELTNSSGRVEPVIWIPAEGVIRSRVAHEKR
jgi:hypothetical protein